MYEEQSKTLYNSIRFGMQNAYERDYLRYRGIYIEPVSYTHLDVYKRQDISFFGKYFKRYTGMSPKQYRENV